MNYYAAIFIPLAAALGCFAGVVMGGGFMHYLFSFVLGILIGIPVVLVLIFTLLARSKRNGSRKGRGGIAIGAVSYIVFSGVFYASGSYIFMRREAEVHSYVDAVLPLLDAYKTENGRYPERLDEVTGLQLPYYFKDKQAYSSKGGSFTFYYETPDSIMGGMMLTDKHRSWSIAD